jgi:indole-3-glycerol phosphate synthase
MNILDKIIEHKRKQVAARKDAVSVAALEKSPYFSRKPVSLSEAIRKTGSTGIIAEFKRKSPSKGIIHPNASVEDTTEGYARAGAAALSVLTDEEFFGGSSDDLSRARGRNACPILRKDFTIDEYQIVEAKAIGADAILLIAAVLTSEELKNLASFAHSLGLDVLLEVHDKHELSASLDAGADLIGVNNRNLKTFDVSLDTSKQLADMIPHGVVKVSESGISKPEAIVELRSFDYQGFLIGENFMKEKDPASAAADFIQNLGAVSK